MFQYSGRLLQFEDTYVTIPKDAEVSQLGYCVDYDSVASADDNIAVVEYEEGILAVRLFFTIEEEAYDLFLEASNSMMMYNYSVKAVVLDDMKNIMFGCEIPCDTVREFRKFFPRCIGLLQEGLRAHKSEMRRMILADQVASNTIPATDESQLSTSRPKIVS